MEEVLVSLLDNILGEHEKESGDWYSYNCPKCAENEGIDCDHKGNLEVNVYEGWCHCWKCNYASDILRLIKPYATKEQYDEYVYNLKLIRDSSLYELNGTNSNTIIERMVDVTLPDGYSEITKETTNDAVEYLFKRGIGFDIIKRFNIGFTKNSSEAFNRIIIPSYNRFGSLNYWVGRDYTGKSKLKYKNPKVEKRGFVFNEWLINWYEPVTLVEGPFDHIVIPNSIPLLGKTLNEEFATFDSLLRFSHERINILLDDDAIANARKMYKFLNSYEELKGRIRIIECPTGYDASDIYREFKEKGVAELLRTAKKIDEFDLLNIK